MCVSPFIFHLWSDYGYCFDAFGKGVIPAILHRCIMKGNWDCVQAVYELNLHACHYELLCNCVCMMCSFMWFAVASTLLANGAWYRTMHASIILDIKDRNGTLSIWYIWNYIVKPCDHYTKVKKVKVCMFFPWQSDFGCLSVCDIVSLSHWYLYMYMYPDRGSLSGSTLTAFQTSWTTIGSCGNQAL